MKLLLYIYELKDKHKKDCHASPAMTIILFELHSDFDAEPFNVALPAPARTGRLFRGLL